ncbi:MAG: hypothetical protein JXP34_01075 [Planctomycetes bacterium]|nr:hypothetical protein [Planctomycetota bacterium]
MIWRCTLSLIASAASLFAAGEPLTVGVCNHFGQGKGELSLNLERLKAARIASIRDEISWGSVERERGKYVIASDRDAFVRRCARAGIAPLLILDYGNRFYDAGGHPRSPEAIEGFCRYAEFMVRHFGRDVRLYEVWNEWDIGIGLPKRVPGSPEDYMKLLRTVYPRIKAVDPDATVVGGGGPTSGGISRGWLDAIVELGALECCDILSIHTYNYSPAGPAGGPEAWAEWTRNVQGALAKRNGGREVPFLITEMGWPSHAGPRGRPAETCAAYLARLFLLAPTMPYIRGIWWYDFQDDGWDRSENEHNFGIVRPDLTPKPAYHAVADLADLVAKGEFLGTVDAPDAALRILRFRHEGAEAWAIWSADDRPRQVILERTKAAPAARLRIREVGRPTEDVSWGHRGWADGRGAALDPNRFSRVIGAMPHIVAGDLARIRVASVVER